ncbi:hypothetical protein [Mycobacterium kansasii]|uniref:hypothetical protein n=1 Tax=Mycobacterium kansasii TaxID=1768 RepID=UPI001CE269D5|nr:hypothetical protein [Mycobacterium kansasii]UCA22950.1 hypothetical protein LA359_28935 [Mycobacterium kansasii]
MITAPARTAAPSSLTSGLAKAHVPVGIYDRCRCEPGGIDYLATHFINTDAGLACERGLVHLVCAQCCTGANEAGCETHHVHHSGKPWCPGGEGNRDQAALATATTAANTVDRRPHVNRSDNEQLWEKKSPQ